MSPDTSTLKALTLARSSFLDPKVHFKAGTEPFFPEGGTAGWCTVIGGALVLFCGFGYTSSFGVYQDFYTRHYLMNESPSAISWIGATNAFMAAAFGLISGALHDRGYFYQLLIGGSALQSFSLFMLSFTQPGQYYQIFLAQGVALGMAQGLLHVPTMTVVSQYFRVRRTLAMSIVACGSSLGSIIHPIMLNNMFNRGVGFANGVWFSALLVSILLFIACFLMRTRLEPPNNPPSYWSAAKGISRDVPFCVTCIGLFCVGYGFYYPLFYLQLDSIQHGNSATFSFYSFVILNWGGFMGRLSAPLLAPRIGVPMLMAVSTIMCGFLILAMIGLGNIPSVVAIGTIYGYFSGIFVALVGPIVAHLTTEMSQLGVRMGVSMVVIGFGALLGGPSSGALLTPHYKWWRPALLNGLITLVGSLLLIMVQFLETRRKTRSPEI